MIEHSNIIYMPNISALGGIETYVYELVKKYKDLDICVVTKRIDEKQHKRLQELCPVYIHTNQKIQCDVAIINYDISIIDFISKNAKIYQCVHYDFTSSIYPINDIPKAHPRITAYLGITQYLTDALKKYYNNTMLCYNPLTIDEDKPIIIVSATRLHKNKGVERMKKLIKAMDKRNINYLWICLTGDINVLDHPKVVMIKNRLDVSNWLSLADYVCLLSDSEACSYTLNEALYRNIPIITTPLPYLEELGVKDGINSYIVEFDCSNIEDVANKIKDIPKFKFNKPEDKYKDLFTNIKGNYKEVLKMDVKVRCIKEYFDCELDKKILKDDEYIVKRERADVLTAYPPLVEIIEIVEPIKKEDKKKPTKKVEKK